LTLLGTWLTLPRTLRVELQSALPTACTPTYRKIHGTSAQGFRLPTSHLATMMSVPKTHKFVWPCTKVPGELNMQETNAAAYQLLVNECSHSSVYMTLLAAVEDLFAATMLWHAQGNTETPTAEDLDTWTEGVKAEGNPLKDDYLAAILPNFVLRRNLARVHAQLIESARKLKITGDDAREAFSLSLIIELNRKHTLGLIDSFDKHNVLRSLKRHPIALMSLKTS